MTGNLTTSGEIKGQDLVALNELHVDGDAFLNDTLRGAGITASNVYHFLATLVNLWHDLKAQLIF